MESEESFEGYYIASISTNTHRWLVKNPKKTINDKYRGEFKVIDYLDDDKFSSMGLFDKLERKLEPHEFITYKLLGYLNE